MRDKRFVYHTNGINITGHGILFFCPVSYQLALPAAYQQPAPQPPEHHDLLDPIPGLKILLLPL